MSARQLPGRRAGEALTEVDCAVRLMLLPTVSDLPLLTDSM